MTERESIFWFATGVVLVFIGLLAFTLFSEWYTVSIRREIENYPWGPVNENPWFYESPYLYSSVMLIELIRFPSF